jgi:hypothetical protein
VNVPTAELALAAVPSAVRLGRIFAADVLRHWQLAHIIEDAELITSELVTNAIQATGLTTAPEHWPQLADLAMIQVRFTLYEYVVLIDRAAARSAVYKGGSLLGLTVVRVFAGYAVFL